MRLTKKSAFLAVSILLFSFPAFASLIISGSGVSSQQILPTDTIASLTSDTTVYYLPENNYSAISPLFVGVNATPGFSGLISTSTTLSFLTNDVFGSYYIHYDPINATEGVPRTIRITVDPSEEIAGVIFKAAQLDNSKPKFGLTTVTYPAGANAQLENPDTFFTVSANFIDVQLTSFGAADDFRVITLAQPIPEPGTMMLLGSGLIGLAGYGRRRFKK